MKDYQPKGPQMTNAHDREIVRELAKQVAEIACLPVQEEKRKLWRKLNGLQHTRPMVTIDQVCWNEMDIDEELTLRCVGPECREYERDMRITLFRWKHFPVDMVVDPFVRIPMVIERTGFGVGAEEEIAVTDPENSVVSHAYRNQFTSMEDLEKIKTPRLKHDPVGSAERLHRAEELFGDIIEAKLVGVDPYLSVWDPISQWMSVEGALYGLIDQPDLMHAIANRVTCGYLSMLDSAEEQGILCQPQSLIHCTGAFTDELPSADYDPAAPKTKDIWMFGLAQMFSTVSPEMFDEFEVTYATKLCKRFGLVYYGCCDPLDRKMDQVRKLPNVRKISMSPWADQRRGAEEISADYVFSRKPNPAFLAFESFSAGAVREDLQATVAICKEYGCPLELILKDISTVRHDPQRLFQWADIAMQVALEA